MKVLASMLVMTGVVTGVSWLGTNTESESPPISAAPADLRSVFANGWVESSGAIREVSAEQPGRLVQIELSEGDRITVGDVLFRVDRQLLDLDLAVAEAHVDLQKAELDQSRVGAHTEDVDILQKQLERARLQTRFAHGHFERATKLNSVLPAEERQLEEEKYRVSRATEAVFEKQIRQLQSLPHKEDVVVAEARLKVAQARVATYRKQIDQCVVRAQVEAEVIDVMRHKGEWVDKGAPIVRIAVGNIRRVRAFVEELDALAIERGLAAKVSSRTHRALTVQGQVSWVSPVMSRKRLSFHQPKEREDVTVREVLIKLDHDLKWPVGTPVDVQIEMQDRREKDQPKGMKEPQPSIQLTDSTQD